MKKNKLLALCVLSLVSILSSCGGSKPNTQDTSSSKESNSSEVSSSEDSSSKESSSEKESSENSSSEKDSSETTSSQETPSSSSSESNKQLITKLKNYAASLLEYNLVNPYNYIPEAMIPSYKNNFVESPISSFDTNVQVSDFNKQGYGEQWQMVVENLNQMITLTKALDVVEGTMALVSNAIDTFIETATTEEINHTFDKESFKATLSFQNDFFSLVVNFKNQYNVPAIGAIQPVLKLGLDVITNDRVVYIALNDNNIIKYTMKENIFELALTYGITLLEKTGSRTCYFITEKNGSLSSGHIYEYTSLEGHDVIKACADYYVTNDYVSVVGNKASGMVVFAGYVNELYNVNQGRLLGYKVQEELAGVAYNTLWFNLWDIEGINSVKVNEKTDTNPSKKSTVDVYINGSSTLLVPTYNTKLTVKTSRKYDIELRKRYFYKQVEDKVASSEVEVPMMFIQDDNDVDTNYSDFVSDFKKDNKVDVRVSMSNSVLTKIRSDYDSLIPAFKENKEAMSSELINTYLKSFNI